ncbi:hypothetical protein EON66_00115 [archaeon]|nr:MAG: hypothetical protein EON66_00115 [archaeon]
MNLLGVRAPTCMLRWRSARRVCGTGKRPPLSCTVHCARLPGTCTTVHACGCICVHAYACRLEDWWLEFIYLRPRWPIAVWMNYLGVNLSDDLAPFSLDQTTAAALMLSQVLKFRQLVVSEELEPETLAGRPLCMDQYTRMFNSCRVPGVECDELRVFEHTARHVVVLRNNRIFSVRVLSDDGRVLPFTDILCALDDVLRASCNLFEIESMPAVSVLTSEDRAVWAKVCTAHTRTRSLPPWCSSHARVPCDEHVCKPVRAVSVTPHSA